MLGRAGERRCLGWGAAAAVVALAAPACAQVRSFNLPAQDAVTGIPAFAAQAGVQILVMESAARGRRTAQVKGAMPVRTALARLLTGSGLYVTSDDGRTLVLARQAPPPALAPPPEAQVSPPVEELVVTALRRKERAQESPVSVRVLTAAALRNANAQDYRDYLTTIPGVNYTEGGLRSIRVTIRGISDGGTTSEPLTAIYIDETPITESFTSTLDPALYDVERVEVLKGPQGTLYGSGSMGGTVRVITRKPQLNLFDAAMDATLADVDHGGWNRRIDGVVNLPIIEDRAALRISAGYRQDAGWIDNVFTGEDDVNTVEKRNIRAQLLAQPDDHTKVIFGFLYQNEDLGAPFYESFGLPAYETSRIYRESGGSNARLYSLTVQHDAGWMSLISASNYLSKSVINTSDATTALSPLVARFAGVAIGPTEGLGVASGDDLNLFTQEVRLSSVGKHRLDWLVGAFYSNAATHATTVFDFSQSPSTAGVVTGPQFYDADQEYRTRQIAAFGELTWNLTDKLSLTAGLRAFDVDQRNMLVGSGLLNGGSSVTQQTSSASSTTQKYLLKYQATTGNMIYAQAAQGYRNGGPTGGFPQAACAADLAAIGLTTVPTQYGPDSLWNYEVGSKNTLMGGRMTLNGSVFYIDWSNMQTLVGLSCGFGLTINAGKAVSKGAELETSINPVKGLTLNGAVSYVDATLRESIPHAPGQAGDRLPFASRWSWNVSAEYEHDLGGGYRGFVRGEANYVGDRWSSFESITARARLLPAYTTFNARVGITRDRWNAALFGTNLTDAHIITSTPGTSYEIVGTPRTVGVKLGVNF